MIQNDVEPILFEIIKNDIEEVHLAQWVDKINSHNHLDRRLLIFSDSGFSLCRLKAFSKFPEVTKFFSWFDLQSIELNDNVFKFTFDSNDQEGRTITFSFDHPNDLLDILFQHLANVLTPSEYPKISVGPYISIEKYNAISVISGLARLKANIFYDHEVNDEIRVLIDTYKNFLFSGITKLNLGLFGESSFIGLVIDSLNVVSHVTSIIFPSTKNSLSHWPEFCDLIKHSRYIKEITTHEKITKGFAQINLIDKNEISKTVESISFGNLGLRDKEVNAISKLYRNSTIKSIKFIKAKSAMRSLRFNLDSFLNNSNFKSITFDKIFNINVLTAFRIFRTVEHIGITACGIELSEALPVICSLKGLIKIKSINLSWNNSYYLLSKTNLSLPDCIEEMYFDNVRFRGLSLQAILAFFECQKSPTKLAMHINNIVIGKEFYQSLFKFCQFYLKNDNCLRNEKQSKNNAQPQGKTVKCFNLNKVHWDNNEISKPLLQFFSKNDDLSLLSLNGSDFGSDDETINELIYLIKHTKSIKELHLAGNLRFQLPPEKLELIMQSFTKDQRSINRLDISLHCYRPESLKVLSEVLLANRSISYIDFTKNNILKKNVWHFFFKKLLTRGTPLDFPIPQAEFCEMYRTKEATKDDIIDLFNMIAKIKKGNKEIKIPPETVNPTSLDDEEPRSIGTGVNSKSVPNSINKTEKDKNKNQFSWEITEIPVPTIDNTNIKNSLESEFGLDSLFIQSKS